MSDTIDLVAAFAANAPTIGAAIGGGIATAAAIAKKNGRLIAAARNALAAVIRFVAGTKRLYDQVSLVERVVYAKVTAAQQVFAYGSGSDKKAWAVQEITNDLALMHVKVSPALIDSMVESAVYAMKAARPAVTELVNAIAAPSFADAKVGPAYGYIPDEPQANPFEDTDPVADSADDVPAEAEAPAVVPAAVVNVANNAAAPVASRGGW
jgi:hypothetical protein